MKQARLENWMMVQVEPTKIYFTGDVMDDESKRWEDGTPVRTSPVQVLSFEIPAPYVKTLNTFYRLGKPAGGTRTFTETMENEETNPA